ncbi:BTB/POZ domain-containing protein 6-like [Paramacrobiotus metropolitanus]|uniref:BTB/POZ domain-containing protein 6-like n=1 Tax=Paramacrobiotus metropolitanus TaxID=2943436 RepID=UPI00244597E3|nr:BTB/POZ domain-containing protein 6-like [Paramacrobiotus metropolitanus]
MCLNQASDPSSTRAVTSSTERRGAIGVLAQRMKRMLTSGELSDVEFAVGRQYGPVKVFSAHKNILCNSSDVFYTMICTSNTEPCPLVIHFPDIPSEAFANLLNYVYSDSLENITADNVFPTLHCADKFGLPFLVDACCDYIGKHLNVDNCLAMLDNANRWTPTSDTILEKCLETVDGFGDAILRSEKFSSIGHESLKMILHRSTLAADENVVYTAVHKWAAQTCEERSLEPSPANLREVLGAALFLVRFPLLNDVALAVGPVQTGLLLPTEVRDIFLHKHALEKPALPFRAEKRHQRSTLIICAGGLRDGTWTSLVDSVECFKSANCNMDGSGKITLRSRTLRYNPLAASWSDVAPMHTGRCDAGVALVGGHIYAVGGHDKYSAK